MALVALPSLASIVGRVVREEGIHAKTESQKQIRFPTYNGNGIIIDFPCTANYDHRVITAIMYFLQHLENSCDR